MKPYLKLLSITILLIACLLVSACGASTPDEAEPYIPEEIPADDGLGGDLPGEEAEAPDFSAFAGSYLCTTPNAEWDELSIWNDGSWTLFNSAAELTGWLEYDEDFETVYAYNDVDGSGCRFDVTDDGVYLASYGYFSAEDSVDWTEDAQNEDAEAYDAWVEETDNWSEEEDDGWTEENAHVDVSEFEGTWYFGGDRASERYLVIDAFGDWTYYSRASGDAEGNELDCGFLTPAEGEASTYYADSYWYDGVRYRVFDFDTDILTWDDEGSFERLD